MRFNKRESEDSGGKFLKLKDGESVTGLFRGEIYEFYSKWENGRSNLTSPDDPDGKPRFRLNFVMRDGDEIKAKIWEFPVAVYNQLADINSEYPLDKTRVKITRQGSGMDTTYMILPLLKDPIGPKAMSEIEMVRLNILEHKDAP